MYTVKQRFVVRQPALVCVGRTITQGSWVPEGTRIESLTEQEEMLYGEFMEDKPKAVKKKESPPIEAEDDTG